VSPMEKLARRLCWIGFIGDPKKATGRTESTYWAGLPAATHERYREEARSLVWTLRAIRRRQDSLDILTDASQAKPPLEEKA
jgi:hypothetical protein